MKLLFRNMSHTKSYPLFLGGLLTGLTLASLFFSVYQGFGQGSLSDLYEKIKKNTSIGGGDRTLIGKVGDVTLYSDEAVFYDPLGRRFYTFDDGIDKNVSAMMIKKILLRKLVVRELLDSESGVVGKGGQDLLALVDYLFEEIYLYSKINKSGIRRELLAKMNLPEDLKILLAKKTKSSPQDFDRKFEKILKTLEVKKFEEEKSAVLQAILTKYGKMQVLL